MDIDDFFDDDFTAEEAAWIGGFLGIVEDEEDEERKRKKLEKEMFGPDEPEEYDDEDEY